MSRPSICNGRERDTKGMHRAGFYPINYLSKGVRLTAYGGVSVVAGQEVTRLLLLGSDCACEAALQRGDIVPSSEQC